MLIKDLLKLTHEKSIDEIAREELTVGKGKAKEALKKAGCTFVKGKRGWYPPENNVSILERSIYDFVEGKQYAPRKNSPQKKVNVKPSPENTPNPNVSAVSTRRTFVQNEQTKKKTNELNSKENLSTIWQKVLNAGSEIAVTSEKTEQMNVKTNELSSSPFIDRKRASFDIDKSVLKGIKVQAVLEEKPVYEIVEKALRKYLEESQG